MPNTATSGDATTQADDASQGQAPTATTAQAAGAQTSQADSAAAQSTAETNSQQTATLTPSEIAALRRENASFRARVRALEAAQTQAQQASMTDLERAQHERDEAKRQLADAAVREQDRNVRLAAIEHATRLNFRSPDLAYRLIDRAEVEFDDSGEPKNIAKLLKAVLDAEPYLAKGAGGDFGGGQRGSGNAAPTDFNAMIRQKAGRNVIA